MRRKGFTLIELLAIIVLLAIVALIATPQILRLIENGQKNSFLRSVEGIVRTVRLDNSKNEYFSDNYTITNGIIKNSSGSIIKHEGGKNENGIVSIDEDGKVSYTIYDGKWIANKNYDTEEMDVKNYSEAEVNSSIVTVTFDANGGNVSTTNKTVRVNSNYGELPIPTREGYTFKGWNGKNILNYDDLLSIAKSYGIEVDENGNITDVTPTTDARNWNLFNNNNWIKELNSGTYSLTLYFMKQCTDKINNNINVVSENGDEILSFRSGILTNVDLYSAQFSISDFTTIGILIKAYDGVYRIQLEEGDTATPYEPYYITSTTKVVQNKNHTLKAIWEKNE